MADVRYINAPGQSWIWLDGLPVAAVIIDVTTHTVVAANSAAGQMTGIDRSELAGTSAYRLVPDYLIPTKNVLLRWVEQASGGKSISTPVDLLLESEGSAPIRLTGQMSPADAYGQFALLSFTRPPETTPTSGQADAVIRTLMSDIGRIASSSLDLNAACQQFAISIMQVVPVEHVAVLLRSADTESLDVVYSTGRDVSAAPVQPLAYGPIQRAMEIEVAVLLSEDEIHQLSAHDDGARSLLGRGVASAACVPFVISGTCIGVVLLGSSQAEAISTADLRLLEDAGSQVAGTISNVMLHEALSHNALEREVLADIGRIASAASDFAGALPGIADQIQRFMPVSELYVHEPIAGLTSSEQPYS